MAAAREKAPRREVTARRAKARADRAKRAEMAAKAWQASGKAPSLKGRTAAEDGDDVLTPAEVRALLETCGTSTTGIRNAALVALLYGTAMRVSEACGLFPADLDLAGGTNGPGPLDGSIYIRARKGGKHDLIGISGAMVPYLVAWTERRAGLGLTGRDAYFCAIAGESLGNPTSTSYWRHLLPRLAAKAGIEGKRVHPHGLRRTAATHMRDSGIPLDVIQRQLGHKNLATTQVYLGARADAEHRRIVSDWGAQAHGATGADTGAPPAGLADAMAAAMAAFAKLPADVRESMTPEQVHALVAGTVGAWTVAGEPGPDWS